MKIVDDTLIKTAKFAKVLTKYFKVYFNAETDKKITDTVLSNLAVANFFGKMSKNVDNNDGNDSATTLTTVNDKDDETSISKDDETSVSKDDATSNSKDSAKTM